MQYKVVPFVASINPEKGKSDDAAKQLEALIKAETENGWSYVRLESVATYVQPTSGCFGIGASQGYTTSKQMAVFERK